MSQVRPVVRTCLTCADARLHPQPAHRRRPPRAADAAHVRAHAARRDPRLRLADRQALGRAGRRLGARHPRRGLGRRLRRASARGSTTTSPRGTRCRRRSGRGSSRSGRAASASGAASGSASLAGAIVVRRAGRERRLFMDAVAPGLLLAQGIGRIGNWWNQELYGKPTDLCRGRSRSTPRTGPSQYFDRATFHPTFLYELIWDFARRRRPALRRPPLPDPAAGALRALRRLVHVRPLLRGAAADRPGAPHRRAAAERLGLDHRLRRLRRLLRLAPVPERRRAPKPPSRRRSGRRWRSPRAASGSASTLSGWPWPSASSSWTSTRSRGRSTSCSRSSSARSCRSARSTWPRS